MGVPILKPMGVPILKPASERVEKGGGGWSASDFKIRGTKPVLGWALHITYVLLYSPL